MVLLGIYRREFKSYVHHKTCTWMSTATLFRIAKTWKKPRCPSVGDWINKVWYIQTMEYSSALKGNELSGHGKTWRKLKCMLLRERSTSERIIYCMISNYVIFSERQKYGDKEKISGCQGLGVGWIGEAQRFFVGRWNFSVWYYKWIHVIIHCSKPMECTAPRVNPNVNCGRWGMMMRQCRFVSCNKCPALVEGVA